MSSSRVEPTRWILSVADLLGLSDLPGPDTASGEAVRQRSLNVLRPAGALSRLDEIAVWLAEWQRSPRPIVERPAAVIFVADHGVASEGVSAYDQSITRAMLDALNAGVATAAVMARHLEVDLVVVDVGVGRPTGNIRIEPALDPNEFEQALLAGRRAVAELDTDLLILGEMGIGNTTPAAAIATSLFGSPATKWVGPGTGVNEAGIAHKASVVSESVQRAGDVQPIEALRHLGGSEMVAMAGAAIEARHRSIPVLLDGYVVASSLMPLECARPGALDHCWPAHVSSEPGHRLLLEKLGRKPILDLHMRLGEGSGALAALPIVKLAAASVTEVATFSEWGLTSD